MNNSIATNIHRISPSRFVRVMAHFKASTIAAIVGAVLLVAIGAGYMVNDIFFVVGPALLLVICPGVIMTIFYYYALSPTAAMLTLPHRVVFTDDKINIDYYKNEEETHPDESSQPKQSATYHANHINAHLLSSDILITKNSGRGDIVAVVPFDSFTSSQNLNSAIELLHIAPTYNSPL